MKPMYRSRSSRRIKKKLPGGRNVTHFAPRKPKAAHCAICGSELHGVPKDVTSKVRDMAKTYKRPERAFGGVLCARCTREEIKDKVRALEIK